MNDRRAETKILTGHVQGATSLSFAGDGRQLAAGTLGGWVNLWDVQTGRLIRSFAAEDEIYDVAFSPKSRLLAFTGYRKGIQFWNPATGLHQRTIALNTWSTTIAFSPDGDTLAAGTQDGKILFFDPQTGRQRDLIESPAPICALIFDTNAGFLVGGFISIYVWNINSKDIIQTIEGHRRPVLSLAISKDGLQLASASKDKTARVWDRQAGTLLHTLTHPTPEPIPEEWKEQPQWKLPLTAVSFSPDGRFLATGGADRVVYLWNPKTGETLDTFEGHRRAITSLTFAPDSHWLASASMDGTVRVWPTPYEKSVV